MPLVLVFYKGERGGLGRFVQEATTFEHSVDKIISIILNSDGANEKDGEADEAIDATLCDIDIYCKKGKQFKSVGQCTDSGGGEVTKVAAVGLSGIRRQDDVVYDVFACNIT